MDEDDWRCLDRRTRGARITPDRVPVIPWIKGAFGVRHTLAVGVGSADETSGPSC